jgi:hypothetical protein
MPYCKTSTNYLFLIALYGLAVPGHVHAQTPISIVNHSFETDAITGSTAPAYSVGGAPTGWVATGTSGARGLLAPNATSSDAFYPGATSGFDGNKVEFHYAGAAGIRQTLGETLAAGTRYTLTVATGTRATKNGAPFGGYDIRLDTESGALVGSWIGAGRNPAPLLQFADTSRSFVTGPAPSGLGERLRISLSMPGAGNSYADLDNVRLTKAAEPRAAGDDAIDVVIVAGQSNAQGWGANAAQLSGANRSYADAPDPRALLGYRLKNLPDPLDNVGSIGQLDTQGAGFAGNYDGFGPELSLGSDLAAAGPHRIAVIKYAIGSAGLQQNYKKLSPTGVAHYAPMIDHVKAMLGQLTAQGYTPTIRAMFWLQGETDALDTSHAPLYAANIKQFITDVRSDLAAPDLPFHLTEINPNMPTLKGLAGTTKVNDALLAAAQADPTRVFFITTRDIKTGFADATHYSADQTIDIGRRWARSYLSHSP